MARIGVFSDTHGSIDHLESFIGRLGALDSVFHLGDYARDAKPLSDRLGTGFVAVRGNCDPWSEMPLATIVEWNGNRILLLHGHTIKGTLALYYEALAQNCNCVIYGHSHIASIERKQGILIVNPGSLSIPRGGQKSSCAVLSVIPGTVTAELLFET